MKRWATASFECPIHFHNQSFLGIESVPNKTALVIVRFKNHYLEDPGMLKKSFHVLPEYLPTGGRSK